MTKVQKWGNSLGMRIPKSCADELEIEAGSSVEISVVEDALVIRPVHRKTLELSELLEGIKDNNLHGEVGTGGLAGREGW